MRNPQIIEKRAFTVVGCEWPFIHALSPDANSLRVIGPLWSEFCPRAEFVPHRIGRDMFGVIAAQREDQRSHPHELLYTAAVAVSSVDDVPTGMVVRTIPASTFAAFTHHGPIHNIGRTVHEIYRVWLPQSPFEQTEAPDVEFYDDRFCADSEHSEMEYWIPVRPKSSPKQFGFGERPA
jgi:AraC family transcriptional regulator